MFKGNLIEDQKYYSLRSKQLLLLLLPSIAIGLLVNFYKMPIWVSIVAIISYITVIILTNRNQDQILNVTSKKIEISKNSIEIKDKNSQLIESIKIVESTKISVKSDYKMAQETMSDLKEEIKGNTEKHFLIFESNNAVRRFDFVIDSYYMLNQLKKLIQNWQSENRTIRYLDK